jgi:outer membrane receptor for ferrienterochelin and colicin
MLGNRFNGACLCQENATIAFRQPDVLSTGSYTLFRKATYNEKKVLFTFVLGFLFMCPLWAQKVAVGGYVIDARTGEPLIGANVFDTPDSHGTATNKYGFFSLTLPAGEHWLIASFVGYKERKVKIHTDSVGSLRFELERGETLDEVVIKAPGVDPLSNPQSGMHKLAMHEIEQRPQLLGEGDVLKMLQLLPGVQFGSEGTSGIHVRGGVPGQNLILLDGVPVYNTSHLFGFFSVFNPDAIKDVTMLKGAFPARYGGRISSVVDIRMKEGSLKKFSMRGSVGLISSKLMFTTPILKEKTSLMIAGRRSYADLFLTHFMSEKEKYLYHLKDINAKISHVFSSSDRLFLSAYAGQDNMDLREMSELFGVRDATQREVQWGNLTSTLRWNHVFSPKLFSHVMVTYNHYFLENSFVYDGLILDSQETFRQERSFDSYVQDWSGHAKFEYSQNENHTKRFGWFFSQHNYSPGSESFYNSGWEVDETEGRREMGELNSFEYAFYLEDDWNVFNNFQMNLGIRFAGYHIDETDYYRLEPRLSMVMRVSQYFSLKGAVSRMGQFVHLLGNNSVGYPNDVWLPATSKLTPQDSWHYNIGGVFRKSEQLGLTVEGYYKDMKNLPAYDEGMKYFPGDIYWEDKIVVGEGKAYGIEASIDYAFGQTSMDVAYTYSKSTRKFAQINEGKSFPFRYNRKHDFIISGIHEFSKKVDLGINWVFTSGPHF